MIRIPTSNIMPNHQDDVQQFRILNITLRITEECIGMGADVRHAETIVKELQVANHVFVVRMFVNLDAGFCLIPLEE